MKHGANVRPTSSSATCGTPPIRPLARRPLSAFQSIDEPLARNIARWQEAIEKAPGQWSAHEELARLAEQRNDNTLAARHYREAWRLRPAKTELLVDLARVLQRQGPNSETRKALSTAWHFGPPRVREAALALNGGADPGAGAEPWSIPKEPSNTALGAAQMASLSFQKSYLPDAYRYYREAVSQNPEDFESIYQLGVVSNLLGNNREAVDWFRAARLSPNALVASRARTAYSQLWPSLQRFRLTAWAIPFYSSRWGDAFVYGQGRAEWRPTSKQVWLYGSFRVIGDSGGSGKALSAGGGLPPALSERTMILGGGILWKVTPRLHLWGEAGEAYRYADVDGATYRFRPDYRGGFSYLKGWGRLIGSERGGWFTEVSLDGFYVSRFDNDLLLYPQARAGYTLKRFGAGPQLQLLMNFNVTKDRNGEYWGNIVEAGPGLRLRLARTPSGHELPRRPPSRRPPRQLPQPARPQLLGPSRRTLVCAGLLASCCSSWSARCPRHGATPSPPPDSTPRPSPCSPAQPLASLRHRPTSKSALSSTASIRACPSSGRSRWCSPLRRPVAGHRLHPRTLDRRASRRRLSRRRTNRLLDRRRSGPARLRAFPFLPQALMELGLRPLAATRSLWAFFDSCYRLRADPDYLAARWRRGGMQAIHIAAWHYWEPDPARDAWLAASSRPATATPSLPTPGSNSRTSASSSGSIIPSGARKPPPARMPTSTGASS